MVADVTIGARSTKGVAMPLQRGHVRRIGPIMLPSTHPSIGTNINGPALISVPPWLPDPLGRYYLYFADHKGSYIRLAYADHVAGPYTVHPAGSLQLADSCFPTTAPQGITVTSPIQQAAIEAEGYDAHFTPHIASPDVVVDHERQTIFMAFHGLCEDGAQLTRMAQSADGVSFTAHQPLVAFPYLRILPQRWKGYWLAMSMPGIFYRSTDLLSWEAGAILFANDFRHCALLRRGDTLYVYWTRVGDTPEHILRSTIDLSSGWDGWLNWAPSSPQSVLLPELPWEGADLPLKASARGQVTAPVRQLRDPAILEDEGRVWLLYAVAGESGIAIAELQAD